MSIFLYNKNHIVCYNILYVDNIILFFIGKYVCTASNVAGKLKLVHSVIVELPLIDFGADLGNKCKYQKNYLLTLLKFVLF